jgi:hypothetical protein
LRGSSVRNSAGDHQQLLLVPCAVAAARDEQTKLVFFNTTTMLESKQGVCVAE